MCRVMCSEGDVLRVMCDGGVVECCVMVVL